MRIQRRRSAGLRRALLVMTIATVYTGTPGRADTVIESGAERVALLELYTSEGCSSCPPAERWLSDLKDHPALWTRLVPVSFHVDYWDYIGWKDRFARPEFGERQRRYAREGGARGVYTPGLMLNGAEWRGWLRDSFPRSAANEAGPLRVTVTDEQLSISFTPAAAVDERLLANVAWLGFDLESDVRRGENRGRVLRSDFVVLDYRQLELEQHGPRHTRAVRRDRQRLDTDDTALVVWVSAAASQAPLQAAGGWLSRR